MLALFGVVNELCNRKLIKNDIPFLRPTSRFMQTESIQTILYVIGISMSVAAIHDTGALQIASSWLDSHIHNIYIYGIVLGAISAFLDNVALVFASISMYDVIDMTSTTSEYFSSFTLNGQYWQLVAYCGGVGGSLLSIGSTAGYALMKSEDVSIWWYVRHIFIKVLIGWLAGLGIYFIIDLFIR